MKKMNNINIINMSTGKLGINIIKKKGEFLMNDFNNELINMIRSFKEKHNISYTELEELTKIHDIRVEQSYLNKLVNGRRKNISVQKFKSICKTIEKIDSSFSSTIEKLKLM